MDLKADLTQGEIPRRVRDKEGVWHLNVNFPHEGQCKTGHRWAAPRTTRFFHLVGDVLGENQNGIYCEPCLIITNKIKAFTKAKKPIDFDPAVEINKLLEIDWEKEHQQYGQY
jgi:hypothetical protein